MKLVLTRDTYTDTTTLGTLACEGAIICQTLEDKMRQDSRPVNEWKVPGKTAIPTGVYDLVVTRSPRFKTDLPLLLNVTGYIGVRIHPGNTHQDTDGCIIPGLKRQGDSVIMSRAAYDIVVRQIQAELRRGKQVTLEVKNG